MNAVFLSVRDIDLDSPSDDIGTTSRTEIDTGDFSSVRREGLALAFERI